MWNKRYYDVERKKGKHWAAFRTVDDLKNLFNEIRDCQSGEEFLNKYKEWLLLTPEDKSIPKNITSLYTHVELVGKIYRILERNTKLISNPDGTIEVEYNGEKVKTIKEAEGDNFIFIIDENKVCFGFKKGKWQARLVKCWIKFPHSFVRLHDINLLKKRVELVNCIASYYKDEVIFATSDFITLFLTPNQDLKEILNPFLDWGFYIEVEETLADLGILNSILDRKTLKARELNEQPRLNILNNRGTKVYRKYILPEIPSEIQPPICDICQRRRGVERIKETVREWVCEKCQKIRDMGEPFKEYGEDWDKEGCKVGWFKFSLNQRKLEDWLQKAFEEYIGENLEKKKIELQNIQKEIQKQDSYLEKKNKEKYELIKIIKELEGISDKKEERKKLGRQIKKISDEAKNLKSSIKELNEKKENLEKYINNLEKFKDEFRPLALQVDFNRDYMEMLKEFWKEVSEFEDLKKPIAEYDELGVFKYSPELTKTVIEKFLHLFERYFPDCVSDESCPVSLFFKCC